MLYHKYDIGTSQRIGLLVYYILVCIVIEVSVSEIKRPSRGLGLGLLRRAA